MRAAALPCRPEVAGCSADGLQMLLRGQSRKPLLSTCCKDIDSASRTRMIQARLIQSPARLMARPADSSTDSVDGAAETPISRIQSIIQSSMPESAVGFSRAQYFRRFLPLCTCPHRDAPSCPASTSARTPCTPRHDDAHVPQPAAPPAATAVSAAPAHPQGLQQSGEQDANTS